MAAVESESGGGNGSAARGRGGSDSGAGEKWLGLAGDSDKLTMAAARVWDLAEEDGERERGERDRGGRRDLGKGVD